MKKLILTLLLIATFIYSFSKFEFGPDAIWKIEQQRREHSLFFYSESRIVHNKLTYFLSQVAEIYLQYLVFSIILIIFSNLAFRKRTEKKLHTTLFYWVLFYPIFPALFFLRPTFVMLLPLIVPFLVGYFKRW